MESILSFVTPLLSKTYVIALGFLGINFLVAIHELGHFFCCKLFGVYTPSFSLGFGPKLYSKKIGSTEFSLSAFPLGGYVEIAGMEEVGQGDQAHSMDRSSSSFANKPYYQKIIILLGGIAVNMAFAWITLTALFLVNDGVPAHSAFKILTMTKKVEKVIPGSPAEKAGIQAGDILNRINREDVTAHLIATLPNKAGQEVTLHFKRSHPSADTLAPSEGTAEKTEGIFTANVTLSSEKGQPTLGVQFAQEKAYAGISLFGATTASFIIIKDWITSTFSGLANMFSKRTTSGLGGPVAVIHSITSSAQSGFLAFLISLCFISVGIACLNLLPLPIFDGGQVVFCTIEALAGRSFENMRIWIHYICWIGVLALIVLLTWRDVVRIAFGA